MTRQDEKLRLQRRLQNQAIEHAAKNRWQDAVEVNLQLISIGEDTDTLNRLGKAYFELNRLEEARDSYQRAIRLTPNNPIARKNLERIDELLSRSGSITAKTNRQLVDLRLFITEIGKTALTQLIDVNRGPGLSAVVTGEKVELRSEGRHVVVVGTDGAVIGRIEPKLAQRLGELMRGGNRYIAAIAQIHGTQVRVIIREIYQDPSQRGRVSFPGSLSEGSMRGYPSGVSFDDYGDDMLEEDEGVEEREEAEEESFGGEEEELGLDDIEQDIGEDDDMNEE